MIDVVGGWVLADMEAANLPEKVATAFCEVTESLVGATYTPVLYVGDQLVHGMNYMIICKQTIVVPEFPEHLVAMVINCSEKGSSIVSIERIV